ncbi:recombination regulator RecX [Acidovorax sp. sic0104]|uniref:recombination regulator RecX n=1 Tax=Acidovorax sp. sic0104 TaxID=2854784 RepID=UPI001C461E3B|nr:recombination regulator RecX [Acidovorax sp. sic0104]MBV7541515.1 recombination regulator RecX [Acidovorax sp. sic0104]
MGFTTLSLKGRALRLLSQREHSRCELQRKLSPHVQEGDDLAALLDDLQARDFISQDRVVESVLHQRASRLGASRIRQELQAKGIDADAVQHALAQLQDTEWVRAYAVWQRKFGAVAEDPRQRARQVRFLMTRGFSSEITSRVVRGEAPEV